MERIGCLIGIDADEAALDAVNVGEDIIKAPAGDGGVSQMLAQHGHGPFPEGGIAGQLLFNKQALAFMGRHAAGLAHGPVRPLLGQALLIKAVAGFMENAHEGGEEFTRGVARGHAHIGGHAAAEGMVRDIKAAMGEIKTDGFHHGFAQRLLLLDGEGGVEGLGGMPGAAFVLGGEGFGDEVLEEGFEFGENRGDIGGAAAGIELLDQRIIGGEFENASAKLGFLAGETYDAFKGGEKIFPVSG